MFEFTRVCSKCGRTHIHRGKIKASAKWQCKTASLKGSCCYCNVGSGNHLVEYQLKNGSPWLGRKLTEEHKATLSRANTEAWSQDDIRDKQTNAIKKAMHRPDVRKNVIDSISKTKYLKVRCDIGQLELIEKWNRLGFKFEPNYQIYGEDFLFYLDGYDKEKNVVIEYDSKKHKELRQQKKDIIRQQKIISILNPKKFWRYDGVDKVFTQII